MSGGNPAVLQPRHVGHTAARRDHRGEPAARWPRRSAITRRWSTCRPAAAGPTRELDADTDALARGLLAAGIGQGDRVGIWAPNCAEWVLLQYATAKIGAILVNINPAYRSHELAYVLHQSGIRLLVSAESFKTSDYRAMIDEVRGRTARARVR